MADIIPFKGTLYNPQKINDISKVVAPPYDVISPSEQETLYNSEPHNIIRILLGKDFPGDNKKENKYTRAAGFLKKWQGEGILRRDDADCIYIYEQQFDIDGMAKRRLGFISLLKLEEFNTKKANVYPHERTLSAPKEDRMRLISSIEANLGPIFAIFADEDKSIDALLSRDIDSEPIIDVLDRQNIRNRLWRVSEGKKVDSIIRLMKDKKLFIADGHHRYESGLAFSKAKKDPRFGYTLTYFTDLYGDGIIILPVHRLIAGVGGGILSGLKQQLGKHFSVEEISSREGVKEFLSKAMFPEKRFVMYTKGKFTGLCLKNDSALDITVLHDLIIKPLQKNVETHGGEISIDFTKDFKYAVKVVDEGKFSLSIIMNPTKVIEVRDMAFSGRRMPQKSTYFYPKVLTGLVINVF